MKLTYFKSTNAHNNRFLIGFIACVLILVPVSNIFADTLACVKGVSSVDKLMNSTMMMDQQDMSVDMDCCEEIVMDDCSASCDSYAFSASVIAEEIKPFSPNQSNVDFLTFQHQFPPSLTQRRILRPPVSV